MFLTVPFMGKLISVVVAGIVPAGKPQILDPTSYAGLQVENPRRQYFFPTWHTPMWMLEGLFV